MNNTEDMDARDEVKSRLPIEDVIGRYLELKKAGRNLKALSPFTKEKTPSFIVSPDKQIWHDFSSGKGGDVFSFVMEVEGLDFRGALELLARRAGVDLEQYEKRGRPGISKRRLYEQNELAAKFFQVQLSANKPAYDYLKKRGINKESALLWQIGYSPNTGNALHSFLKGKGYLDKEIMASGLVSNRFSKLVDMFRGRLMIPLCDSQGRVIGFTARALDKDDRGPKYINTPQTALYDKSRHVFGLHLAKEAIRTTGYAVVVEGNLDVIASHQIGVKQVVATAGTALTDQHLKALGLLTKDIRFCFDADKAGLMATERSIPLASKQNLNVSVLTIPSGKDPDELIKNNQDSWQELIDKPSYAIDWLIDHYASELDLNTAPGKRHLSDIVLPIIKSLSDEVESDHYINLLAKLLAVSPSALNAKLYGIKSDTPKVKLPIKLDNKPLDKDEVERLKIQNNFLSLMLINKKLRDQMNVLSGEMLVTDDGKRLFDLLTKRPDIDIKAVAQDFKDLEDYVKIEVLLYEELYKGLDINELKYEAARLKARIVASYIKTQKQLLTSKLKSSNSSVTRELLEKARRLDSLLNQVKGEGEL
ncbi:MAG: DNA primase [Candidatus Saccharimonadales bacterium]